MSSKAYQQTIDEVDRMNARVKELARFYRDTDIGYHLGMADVELDRAVVMMTRAMKGEEGE